MTDKRYQDPTGGLNAAGRKHYGVKAPAPHPKTPEDAARRDNFKSRMCGMKGKLTSAKTAHDPNSRINLALKKWNVRCD